MTRTHLVSAEKADGNPVLIYFGHDVDAAEAAMVKACENPLFASVAINKNISAQYTRYPAQEAVDAEDRRQKAEAEEEARTTGALAAAQLAVVSAEATLEAAYTHLETLTPADPAKQQEQLSQQ